MRFVLSQRCVLPVLFCLYGMNFMDRSVLGMVSEGLKLDMALSDARMGLLHSILPLALVILAIPAAILNDTIGRRRLISWAAGIWSLAMLGTALACNFITLACARLTAGINEAVLPSGGAAWLSAINPPERRSRAIGMFYVCSPLGMCLGTLAGGGILSLTGDWRAAFLIFPLPGLFGCLLVPRLPDRQALPGTFSSRALALLLQKKTLILTGCAAGFFCILKYSYQAWVPALLMRGYHIGSAEAGLIASSMLLAGAAGPFLGGMLADFMEKRRADGRTKAGALCMAALVAVRLVFYFSVGKLDLPFLWALGILDGIVGMTPTPIYLSICQDVAEERYRSTAAGLLGIFLFLCGGAWGAWLVGVFSDLLGGGAEGLRLAMLGMLAFGVLSSLIYFFESGVYRRERCEPPLPSTAD